jgi:hypothetical protein
MEGRDNEYDRRGSNLSRRQDRETQNLQFWHRKGLFLHQNEFIN